MTRRSNLESRCSRYRPCRWSTLACRHPQAAAGHCRRSGADRQRLVPQKGRWMRKRKCRFSQKRRRSNEGREVPAVRWSMSLPHPDSGKDPPPTPLSRCRAGLGVHRPDERRCRYRWWAAKSRRRQLIEEFRQREHWPAAPRHRKSPPSNECRAAAPSACHRRSPFLRTTCRGPRPLSKPVKDCIAPSGSTRRIRASSVPTKIRFPMGTQHESANSLFAIAVHSPLAARRQTE